MPTWQALIAQVGEVCGTNYQLLHEELHLCIRFTMLGKDQLKANLSVQFVLPVGEIPR